MGDDSYNNNLADIQSASYFALQELIYAENYHDVVKGSVWLPENFSLAPCRWALGYPALYVLYRILNEIKPETILEIGLGVSTKIISKFCDWSKSNHYIVEHDKEWINFFYRSFELPCNTELIELPLIKSSVKFNEKDYEVNLYKGFSEKFADKKFDFICVDGPPGTEGISRVDLIGIIPECLNDSFVILLDDCEREGEKNALLLFADALTENNIDYDIGFYRGEKGTGVLVSKNLSFLTTL